MKQPQRPCGGMTLVEMLVALALVSLLGVGMLSVFRAAQHSYRRIVLQDGSSAGLIAAQRFLRTMLESADPFRAAANGAGQGFEGSRDALVFSAPAQQSLGANGLRTFNIILGTRDDGLKDVLVETKPDHGWILSKSGYPADDKEVLIERVATLEWSYLDDSSNWVDQWSGRGLPALIRLRVTFPPGDDRKWPDILVSPRITEAASCEFDVISQSCRGEL